MRALRAVLAFVMVVGLSGCLGFGGAGPPGGTGGPGINIVVMETTITRGSSEGPGWSSESFPEDRTVTLTNPFRSRIHLHIDDQHTEFYLKPGARETFPIRRGRRLLELIDDDGSVIYEQWVVVP